ncbi:tetratricopeptide repeat protein [Rhizorhabdus dicambivorans]|uniref:DUF3857 domain-containing protein n=1 Tax=Rhizorhabdus dicambivorans TaxID=1850238 RepID=A0A2A4FQ22_9SPHN|nr:tetratricopeptide repeat protein [Rhizorhabdus dicambivorans]ATE64474.1 hypothetical protein CMV14_08735 [Rhizorhabdus dicambivorans]PCE39814.1 hypothetical protein COO09_23485 [Rhizorhabdus dicambivorans]
MRFWIGWMLVLGWMTPALAGDQVEFGPPPAWVKPVAVPQAADLPAQGGISYLLLDEQIDFQAKQTSVYAESIFRINTADGLSAGNISLGWEPQTQRLIVHRLTIQRGKQTIDVLKSGQQFTVLRRESNLESAMLDGVLTANIQPEGLQVGDIVHLVTTHVMADPVLGGHAERARRATNAGGVAREHIRAQWPAAFPIRVQQTPDWPAAPPRRAGNRIEVELTLDRAKPVILTKGAPDRYRQPRMIEFSSFGSWAELADLFVPLYDKAALIPADSPLRAEIERIRRASPDPVKRTEAALMLVQGQVRYVALLMGAGGYTPADASTTWSRRFGDCKAKSALLIAILRALDIAAEPVLVDSDGGDGFDQRLPRAGLFDHVIVRATVAGKNYWLDGTRSGDRRLDQLATPDYGWGLPLTKDAALVRMVPEQLALPETESSLHIDAHAGRTKPAPARAEILFRGDYAYSMSVAIADMNDETRERWLRDYWKRRYDFIAVGTVTQSYDADRREQRLAMEGIATLEWDGGAYWLTDSRLGYDKVDFERSAAEDRAAPYAVNFPSYTLLRETIILPPGVVPDNPNVEAIAGAIRHSRKGTLKGNILSVETVQQSLAPEFPASEAAAAQKTIRALADRYVALRIAQPQSAALGENQAPETSDQFVERGLQLLDRNDLDGAVAAFNAALERDPRNADALAARGFIFAWRKDFAAATRDFNAAAVLDPDNTYLVRSRGYLAYAEGRPADALRYFSRVLEEFPDDDTVRGWRAFVYRDLGNYEAALREADLTTKSLPRWSDLYTLRASIHRLTGKPELAIAEARALVAAKPGDGQAHALAANIYRWGGRREDALREIGRAIEIEPTADFYLDRMGIRGRADVAGKLADADAALRIDPKNFEAWYGKAIVQRSAGNHSGMVETLSAALRKLPGNLDLISLRGQAYFLDGRKQEALRDFAMARAAAKTATDLNTVCWDNATADVDLPAALADCDAAIAKDPDDFAPHDSRAVVLLKMGRLDDAIAGFDTALAMKPDTAESLLGRAIAWSRKGDARRAEADRAAALAKDSDIVETYRNYGLELNGTGGERKRPAPSTAP